MHSGGRNKEPGFPFSLKVGLADAGHANLMLSAIGILVDGNSILRGSGPYGTSPAHEPATRVVLNVDAPVSVYQDAVEYRRLANPKMLTSTPILR